MTFDVAERAHPIRTCIGCRTRKPDDQLVRLSAADDQLVVGERGHGRGAWICCSRTCVASAARSKAFSRALRTKLADAVCADTLLGWLGKSAH